jgi:arylsulfatase A-like enzyme
LYASFADLVGQELNENDALDSENLIEAWTGKTQQGREILFEQAYAYAIRQGRYKYIQPKKNASVAQWFDLKFVDPGFSINPMLFDLAADPGETNNIAAHHPEKVKELDQFLENILNEPTRKMR